MSERDAFERILAALHEAALDPGRWPGASALIDEALGTHGGSVALGDGESEEDYRVYFMWTCLRGQRRRDLERLWFETHYPVDQGLPRLRRQPFNRLIPMTDLYTEEELRTSASYNALRTLAHAGNGINVRLKGLTARASCGKSTTRWTGRTGRPRRSTRSGACCPMFVTP